MTMNPTTSRAMDEIDRCHETSNRRRNDTSRRYEESIRSRSPFSDDEGFQTVSYKKTKKNVESPTSPSPPPSQTTPNQATPMDADQSYMHTVYIKKIPVKYHNQKQLYQALNLAKIDFEQLIVYGTHQAKITSTNANLKTSIKRVSNIIGEPLLFEGPRPTTTSTNKINPTSSGPNFSCVLKGYATDLDVEDLLIEAAEQQLRIIKAWRIRSRATAKDTTLIRLITPHTTTLNILLQDGLKIFGRRYYVEESHAPQPQAAQCAKCQAFNHTAANCPQQTTICPKCAGNHTLSRCTATTTKCANCDGEHPAWTHKCPTRPTTEKEIITAAPIRCIYDEEEKDTDPSATEVAPTNDFLRAIVTALLNIFPEHRDAIQDEIKYQCRKHLSRKLKFSHSGTKLYISIRTI